MLSRAFPTKADSKMKGGKTRPGCVLNTAASHEMGLYFFQDFQKRHLRQVFCSFKAHAFFVSASFFVRKDNISHLLKLQINIFKLPNKHSTKLICLVLEHKLFLLLKNLVKLLQATWFPSRGNIYTSSIWKLHSKRGDKEVAGKKNGDQLNNFVSWSPSSLQEVAYKWKMVS